MSLPRILLGPIAGMEHRRVALGLSTILQLCYRRRPPDYREGVVTKQNLNGRLGQIVDELVRRGVPLDQARREFEKQFIVATLRTNEGNLSRSARSLGVHRNTLRNKVSDLGIAPRDIGGQSARRRRTLRH